jgi:hypothetical protein
MDFNHGNSILFAYIALQVKKINVDIQWAIESFWFKTKNQNVCKKCATYLGKGQC